MAKMTITEALAEIKTIQKRLATKRNQVKPYIALDNRIKDPLHADGGSAAFIKRERQAINDLEQRVVDIRGAIQSCNLSTPLTMGSKTQSVAHWLTWRRELSALSLQFIRELIGGINGLRKDAKKEGLKVSDEGPADITVNINEKELLGDQEQLEKLLGDLDGKLSLLNATTVIELP